MLSLAGLVALALPAVVVAQSSANSASAAVSSAAAASYSMFSLTTRILIPIPSLSSKSQLARCKSGWLPVPARNAVPELTFVSTSFATCRQCTIQTLPNSVCGSVTNLTCICGSESSRPEIACETPLRPSMCRHRLPKRCIQLLHLCML